MTSRANGLIPRELRSMASSSSATGTGEPFSSSSVCEPSSSDSESESPTTRPSILDKLRCPRESTLTCKWRVDHNSRPPGGKRRSSGRGAADPKSVKPSQRVSEFPDEKLCVSGGKLFYLACREEIALKRSIVTYHLKSTKHVQRKEKLLRKDKREKDIAEVLKKNDEHEHPKGETLPTEQRVYRVKVVQTFLRAAIPLNKLDHFRELLEENGFRLTDRRHMSDIVPLIHWEETELLNSEISGKHLSVVFDGTNTIRRSHGYYSPFY